MTLRSNRYAARIATRHAFEAPAECRRGWTPPDVEGITLEVVERIEERLRLRFTAVAMSNGKARAAIRAVVDAPAFRRQCEVGRLTSVGAR